MRFIRTWKEEPFWMLQYEALAFFPPHLSTCMIHTLKAHWNLVLFLCNSSVPLFPAILHTIARVFLCTFQWTKQGQSLKRIQDVFSPLRHLHRSFMTAFGSERLMRTPACASALLSICVIMNISVVSVSLLVRSREPVHTARASN